VGLFLCEARHVRPDLREHLGVDEATEVIGAAYVGAPTVHAGVVAGVSLISFLGSGTAAAWIKLFTLNMLRAREVRGVAQWDNRSLRVHTRLGRLNLVGRPPGGHELLEKTFVYSTDLSHPAAIAQAMQRTLRPAGQVRRIAATDTAELGAALGRAISGAEVAIGAPGLDNGEVILEER
jgi:hypothetical protein